MLKDKLQKISFKKKIKIMTLVSMTNSYLACEVKITPYKKNLNKTS